MIYNILVPVILFEILALELVSHIFNEGDMHTVR